MKRIILFITILLVLGISLRYFYFKMNNLVLDNQTGNNQSKQSAGYQTKTDNQGNVTLEITPVVISSDEQTKFELTLDTHSVELDYDLAKIAQLKDNKGKRYNALSWTGKSGGHHLSGMLIFSSISKTAESVTLIIPQIDNIDRVFTWNLK